MTVKEIVDKVYSDAEFAKKFSSARTLEKAYEVAKECGITMDQKTFENEFKKCLIEKSKLDEKDVDEIVAAGVPFEDSTLFHPQCRGIYMK